MKLTKRQDEIVQSSIDIIAHKGIEALTTKNIAKSLSITEAALYRHFDSKADLMVAILGFFEARARQTLDEAREKGEDSLGMIKHILETRIQDFTRNPAMVVLILSEEIFPHDEKLSSKVSGIMHLNRTEIISILKAGAEKGEIRSDIDPEELFYFVVGPFRMIVTRWRISDYKLDLEGEFVRFWNAMEMIIRK